MWRHIFIILFYLSSLSTVSAIDTLDVSARVFNKSVFPITKVLSSKEEQEKEILFTNTGHEDNSFFLRSKKGTILFQNGLEKPKLFDKAAYTFYRFTLSSNELTSIQLQTEGANDPELYYLDESAVANTLYLMQEEKGRLNYYASFFGISLFCFLAFIHFFNFLVIKKTEYLYYSLYLIMVSFYFYFKYFSSIKLCYLSDCENQWELYISAWTQQIFHCLYVQFVRYFLETRKKYPLYDKVAKVYIGYTLFSLVLLILLSAFAPAYFNAYFDLYRIIALLISFWMIYHIARQWDHLNIFIVVGSSLLVLFAIAAMYYSIIGYYPLGIFPISFMLFGVLFEVLLFSAALTYKGYITNKQKLAVERDLNEEKTRSEQLLRKQQSEIKQALEETKTALELEKQEQIKTLIEVKEKENEMDILLLQMNPHFIFNTMNSLKSFVILDKKEKAVSHIEKMADFIRGVLYQSRTKLIPLSDELVSMQLYFELESERIQESINLAIDIDPAIDPQEIKIPPMLIQPFIENAIWHGLAPSTKLDKKIYLSLKDSEESLTISVRDNGIGRAASSKNDNKQHQSLGTEITKKRISLFNKGKEGLQIIDLKDPGGNPIGTEVHIKLFI